VRPGPVTFTLENADDVEQLVLLERTAWTEDVSTARDVTCLQEFRDLFSMQVVRPGAQLKIASVALLFTDLKSSTAMYEKVGDAPAWALVRDHFALLFDSVTAKEGGIVKTIGDAIMASFVTPAQALRAAFLMQAKVAEWTARQRPEFPVHLKVGVHAGPCLAVNLNDRLDYFGTTVNLAARIQGESVGDDIVLLASLLEQPGVREVLAANRHRVEPFQASLKGLSGTFELLRLWPEAARVPLPA
jgi:adenylate cyclase